MTKQAKILTDADNRPCLDPICARPLLLRRIADLESALSYLRTQARNGTLHPQVVIQNVSRLLPEGES